MKILHIVEASFAGVGRHVLDLAAGQAADGHDVNVVYSAAREGPSFATQRARMVDVSFTDVAMVRGVGLPDISACIKVSRVVARLRPDVIHGHSTKGGLIARIVPALRRGDSGSLRSRVVRMYTPNAVYSMNPGLSSRTRKVVGFVERVLSYRTDVIIAVSPEEQRHLHTIGISPDRVVVVPNGIPLEDQADREAVRAELGLPQHSTVVGFVGRLDDQKNPSLLLDAFAQGADERDDLVLSVVGAGPLSESLKAQAATLGLQDRVWLHGEQPGRRAMAAFDVFVLPSKYEGFPYVLIEAAQAGLTIVTTSGACAEQLDIDGRYGSVVTLSDGISEAGACEPLIQGMDEGQKGQRPVGKTSTKSQDATTLGRAIVRALETATGETSRNAALASGRQFTARAMVVAVEDLFTQRIEG